ncbi:MAG: glycosyltransferase family 9 protein [Deltaproteobacteria bacterium]|nr:glycosyltransferase family 9 protein [Deltaproteobacteria bacterium]
MQTTVWKRLERAGRTLLIWLVGLVLRARAKPVVLPPQPKVLIVRLDLRVGNMLLLLPLLDSLKRRFPAAEIDLLASAKSAALVSRHAALRSFLPYRKRAIFAAQGPLCTPWRLRRRHYDLAVDAANPTDPSTTQALLVRLAGATHTVGVDQGGFGRLFTAPVRLPDPEAHEIEMRLALLAPLPGDALTREMRLTTLPPLSPRSAVAALTATPDPRRLVLNLGARLRAKRLSTEAYVKLAELAANGGWKVILSFGPQEHELARAVHRSCPAAALAPPTDLVELGHLMKTSAAVVTCDTGPMHLAVALGTPTCGIFVSTAPRRYGHFDRPHLVVDAREREITSWLPTLRAWLETSRPRPA